MSTAILIAKLLEIERAVGRDDPATIRGMVLDIQGCVLELEQRLLRTMEECQRLRERMVNCERSHLSAVPERTISKYEEVAMELSRPVGTRKKRGVRRFLSDTDSESIN